MASEFEIIRKYFYHDAAGVRLGVGDDGALIDIGDDRDLVLTTDTLVSGTHFASTDDPFSIGYKSVAVNLSDLAAMGAVPKYVLLSLTLPVSDEIWIEQFSNGIKALLRAHSVALVGGDTTRGDTLSITLTAIGFVRSGTALRRDHACLDDDVWVSGLIGLGSIGLLIKQGVLKFPVEEEQDFLRHLHQPQPRIELGQKLLGIANSAIDVSDGLVADAGHIANQSGVKIIIDREEIPVHESIKNRQFDQDVESSILGGGDDYELLFTAKAEHLPRINSIAAELGLPLTKIGRVAQGAGVEVCDGNGFLKKDFQKGFDHFATRK